MIKRAKYTLLAVFTLIIFFPVLPARSGTSPSQRIRQILNKKENQKTRFALHFVDLVTSQTVFAHRSNSAQVPASNMKLITTAAAVDLLGPDFVYETVFALDNGNLAIFASGDPLLGDPVIAQRNNHDIDLIFEQILTELQKRSLNRISGDLLIDDYLFDDERFHPSWPVIQSNRWFTAQVSALNFNDNCVDVTVIPTQPGKLADFSYKPHTTYVNITNHCNTTSKGTNTCWAAREIGANNITLKSSVRYQDVINVTVERPSAFFGHVLAEYLLAHGVHIDGKLIIRQLRDVKGHLPKNLDILLIHRTPLSDVLTRANQDSLNLAAECLFKTIGAYYRLDPNSPPRRGSWQTGKSAISDFLKRLNVDSSQFTIDDGGGLSRKNRLSPRCITTVLIYMYRHHAADMFRESLANPQTGTLSRRNRFSESTYQDRLYVKTGYIRGSWALSGYCRTDSGRWLAFSILAEKTPSSPVKTIDQMVKEMINDK